MCDKSRIPINSNADVVTTTLKGMDKIRMAFNVS